MEESVIAGKAFFCFAKVHLARAGCHSRDEVDASGLEQSCHDVFTIGAISKKDVGAVQLWQQFQAKAQFTL